MKLKDFNMPHADVAWCPGCGNFSILRSLKKALADLEIPPENLVFVSGIGQAGKLPHYIRGNVFNGLHGRSLSPATGIKAVNPELTVIDISGDGCMYGEGGISRSASAFLRLRNIEKLPHPGHHATSA
jgi:2-oxoglutarate ferredoxin oxidoreductase subunit beta